MGIFPEGEDSRGDHGLGRFVEFRFKGPPGTPSSYITTHTTAPHGRPNLRSRLHCCHAHDGGPRSPQGHVVALDKEKVHFSNWWHLFLLTGSKGGSYKDGYYVIFSSYSKLLEGLLFG